MQFQDVTKLISLALFNKIFIAALGEKIFEKRALGLKSSWVSFDNMVPPGWLIMYVLLTLCKSACGLEITDYDGEDVICKQGLSECTMRDNVLIEPVDAVDVQKLTPKFKLCCKDTVACALCLVIDIELHLRPDNDTESEDHSGNDEDDYYDPKASLTVCYEATATMPTCKKVEFMVNRTPPTQSSLAKMSLVINKPIGVTFGSQVHVYYSKATTLVLQKVMAPSLSEVCSQGLQNHTEECYMPIFSTVINYAMNQVELQFAGRSMSLPSVCFQYEKNGRCQALDRMTIPLYSVTPCMCLQAWQEDDKRPLRSRICPFTNLIQNNLRQNVSVSVSQGQMNNNGSMLTWDLSAPCRLEGEVWLCHWAADSCSEMKGFRQQLGNCTWRQNIMGHWETTGVFEDISLVLSPCVMVEIKGKAPLGPFCYYTIDRWRWSLLAVAVMLLVCLTALLFYLLHDSVKRWAWSWHHGEFVKIVREGHVVVLSPPDVDNAVSESVCRLGSLLCDQGFSVSVDQWSRKKQCTLGPLPWLHSQLLELNSSDGRVLLMLTHKALERAEEWTHRHKEVDDGLPQVWSPYSDVFTASLSLIQADKLHGKAGERFLLVIFDSFAVQPLSCNKRLPEILQGLPLFQLPSQTQALLSELSVGGKRRGSGGRTWTRQKFGAFK